MWKTILENAKLIAGTIMAVAALLVGSWTMLTNIFVTHSYAMEVAEQQQKIIKKLDLDTAYNKAFRLEEKIKRIKSKKVLSDDDNRTLKRLLRDLERTDEHIDRLEEKIYIYEETKKP